MSQQATIWEMWNKAIDEEVEVKEVEPAKIFLIIKFYIADAIPLRFNTWTGTKRGSYT
jgi:hypothetical protein